MGREREPAPRQVLPPHRRRPAAARRGGGGHGSSRPWPPPSAPPPRRRDVLARLRSFLGAWTRRDRFEDALDDEVRFHWKPARRTGVLGSILTCASPTAGAMTNIRLSHRTPRHGWDRTRRSSPSSTRCCSARCRSWSPSGSSISARSTTVGPAGGIFSYPMFRDLQRGRRAASRRARPRLSAVSSYRSLEHHPGLTRSGRRSSAAGVRVVNGQPLTIGVAPRVRGQRSACGR